MNPPIRPACPIERMADEGGPEPRTPHQLAREAILAILARGPLRRPLVDDRLDEAGIGPERFEAYDGLLTDGLIAKEIRHGRVVVRLTEGGSQ